MSVPQNQSSVTHVDPSEADLLADIKWLERKWNTSATRTDEPVGKVALDQSQRT
jgi:hypothetical protein